MIALFLPTLGGGGAERNMVNLARGLSEHGHEVVLVLGDARGPYLEEVPAEVELVDLRSRRMAANLLPLAWFIRTRRPQALLSTPTHTNLVALAARALAGTRCRLVLREANTLSQAMAQEHGLRGRVTPLLVRWLYPLADAVVAVSEGVARDLERTAGVAGVRSIPNPAVTPELEQLARQPVNHPYFEHAGVPVVLAVGSLTAQKDYPTLLSAFRLLRSERECRLLILGDGPERGALEARARELEVGEDVDLPGFVHNPFAYMARAGVLSLSSRWEGWPNVCAQAMAVGTPVVATDCPHGPREILDDGRYGELVPVGRPDALAAAIARTLDAPPDPQMLRDRAGEFTLEKAIAAYAEALGVGTGFGR